MTLNLQPYQYMELRHIVNNLIDNYKSVNDPRTVDAVQSLAVERIHQIIPADQPEADRLLGVALNHQLRREAANKFWATFKDNVVPFAVPTSKQVEKVFRKVKKLKQPNFNALELNEQTFIGWNDIATQRKYMLYYDDNKLAGVYGDLSVSVIKGFCTICHQESNVSLFTAISKKGSEGRYTKKGNYICHDSVRCNQQLYRREGFDQFLADLK